MSAPDRHGGNIYAAARELARHPTRLLDFSASINPLGPSPRVLRAITRAQDLLGHYPDPACLDLRQGLADHHGLDVGQLLIGNGSSELIHLLPRALRINHALVVGPTFSEPERAVRLGGGRVTRVLARRAEHYRPPIGRVLTVLGEKKKAAMRPDVVFVCNPNSPTGQSIARDDLAELCEAAGRFRIRVVVDETFVEYCEHHSILSELRGHRRVLVLRSFTKFYALPGLRAGYVIAAGDAIESIRESQPPWSVNALAQIAGLAALHDTGFRRSSLAFMKSERARLSVQLAQLPGFIVFPSDANFLMVELPPRLAALRLTTWLRLHGLLIRDLSSVHGLTSQMVRVAVRARQDNRHLLRLLGNFLKGFTT
ncbi:MAG: threonine-phosphate decarboxylase CobD [Gemmatimonadales bacterium]